MPIMSLKEFKNLTAKWFSLRNGAIGAIDSKLAAYHKGSPNQAKLRELKNAIDAFIDEKNNKFAAKGGDYHSSKREGKQGVTTLLQQVQAELAAHAPGQQLAPSYMGIAAQVQQRALVRRANAEANHIDINVPVSQQLDYRDGQGLRDFAWNVRLRLTERPTELAVKVAVKLAPAAVIAGDYKARWKRQIQGSWNGASLRIPGAGGSPSRVLPITFELDWKSQDFGGDVYVVAVHQPPPQPAQREYQRTARGKWEATQRGPTVGTDVGTPHMAQWGADDNAAVVHEFGHMIGCPDEYYTVTYNGVPLNAQVYNQIPFTTNSIMNNTGPEGRIFARHYALIKDQYEIWQGLAAGSTAIEGRG